MISDTIESLGAADYSVKRKAGSTYDTNGRAVAGAATTVPIRAHVQPLTGRELAALPEGLRHKETRYVWTVTELRTAKEGTSEPDVIVIDGEDFEIQKVENWQAAGGFYKALAVRDT